MAELRASRVTFRRPDEAWQVRLSAVLCEKHNCSGPRVAANVAALICSFDIAQTPDQRKNYNLPPNITSKNTWLD